MVENILEKKVLDWVLELQDCGVGEILLTSVDNEGTGEGYNLDLYRQLKKSSKFH